MIYAQTPLPYTPNGISKFSTHPVHLEENLHGSRNVKELSTRDSFISSLEASSTLKADVNILRGGGEFGENILHSERLIVHSQGDLISSSLQTTYLNDADIFSAVCNRISLEQDLRESDVPCQLLPADNRLLECICCVNKHGITFFTACGDKFHSTLPFRATSLWITRYGILIERSLSIPRRSFKSSQKNSAGLENLDSTLLYSVFHPLDDPSPVFMKRGNSSQIWGSNLRIIFTSDNHNTFVLAFDETSQLHSIFILKTVSGRGIRQSPTLACNVHPSKNSNTLKSESTSSVRSERKNSLRRISTSKSGFSMNLLRVRRTISSESTRIQQNPSTPFHAKSHSPMAAISRSHSPNSPLSMSLHQNQIIYNDKFNRTSPLISHAFPCDDSLHSNKCSDLPLWCLPRGAMGTSLYLEHIWSENATAQDGTNNRCASKAFLSQDLVGRDYMCYFIQSESYLNIIQLYQPDLASSPAFGDSVKVSAVDVSCNTVLKMILVLDGEWNITVYSGLEILGKLHIPSTIPNSLRNLAFPAQGYNRMVPSTRTMKNCSILLDDHDLTDSRKPGTHLLDANAEHCISSIRRSVRSSNSSPTCFLHSTEDGFVMSNGDTEKSKIVISDARTSPLVKRCLQTLQDVLSQDLATQLRIRWFLTRNAPGPEDLTLDQEWESFVVIFFNLFGYDINESHMRHAEDVGSISQDFDLNVSHKKQRILNRGGPDDWHYVTNLSVARGMLAFLSNHLCFNFEQSAAERSIFVHIAPTAVNMMKIDSQSRFTDYLPHTIFSLHLLYEEMKLACDMDQTIPFLAKLLCTLTVNLSLVNFQCHYQEDFPMLKIDYQAHGDHQEGHGIIIPQYLLGASPDILRTLYSLLVSSRMIPYPHMSGVNPLSRDLIEIFRGSRVHHNIDRAKVSYVPKVAGVTNQMDCTQNPGIPEDSMHRIIESCWKIGMNQRWLGLLPPIISIMLNHVIHYCKANPSPLWSPSIYDFIQREDLAMLKRNRAENDYMERKSIIDPQTTTLLSMHNRGDGMEFDYTILQLRFDKDHRVEEVRRLLNSSEPVIISVAQRNDVSDHEFIEEQEKFLYVLSIRTMSLPIGRGMFTLKTSRPINTEQLTIPPLCLSGKAPPRGTSVEMTHIDIPNNLNLWPLFHNGVAAGLRVHPNAHDVDSTWIVFNKQPQTGFGIDHAGFLMALGLNGHLKNLAPFSTYEYLVECHETTSVGLLLGLSATHRCTMDISMTKLLSLHVESLLPPTSIELNVHQNVQVAALMGLGLIYQETNHSHIAHALLVEIGRPPGPEMKNCVDRESYSLSAGLALGLVVLASGGGPDLDDISDSLHYYIMGGNVKPFSGTQKEKYKSPSYQIREGHSINVDVTSPGATLALGMMYLRSGNTAVAEWMTVPDTQYLLDFVQPDFLLLRVLTKSLILWDNIKPSRTWVSSHVPQMIARCKFQKPKDVDLKLADWETVNQAYCNIIAGSCMAIGLKYAGTGEISAFRTVHHFLRMFISLLDRSVAELTGRATLENCLNVILLSCAIIMSGTGNLEILRICRYLRTRVGPANSTVTYGSHVATHMALGLLFLGGGRYTLRNDPASVALLIISLFPKFPTHSNDNRYHLQALRHFYVLATEPRLILPKDVHNEQYCYISMKFTMNSDSCTKNECVVRAPFILPQIEKLEKLESCDDRYWRITFERRKNFQDLEDIFGGDCILYVKRKAGCLSHVTDPQGSRTSLAQTLTANGLVVWRAVTKQITSFTTNHIVRIFGEKFLGSASSDRKPPSLDCHTHLPHSVRLLCCPYQQNVIRPPASIHHVLNILVQSSMMEKQNHQYLTSSVYDCVAKDRIVTLAPSVSSFQAAITVGTPMNSSSMKELRNLHPFLLNTSLAYIEAEYTENLLAIEQRELSSKDLDPTSEQEKLMPNSSPHEVDAAKGFKIIWLRTESDDSNKITSRSTGSLRIESLTCNDSFGLLWRVLDD